MRPPAWDPHLHAAPSSVERWGDDLDVVDAASSHRMRGFVLKSHHEQTASRAQIATAYARRRQAGCVVLGSVVLNPWIDMEELERALELGARVVWWPTRARDGSTAGLPLPELHERALELVARHPRVLAATGHLGLEPALELVDARRRQGLPVVVTHPLNADVGVGLEHVATVGRTGAFVEIDAYSLALLRARGIAAEPLLRSLDASDAQIIFSSDGGQRTNGDPFSFGGGAWDQLVAILGEASAATIARRTDALMTETAGE